MKTKDNRISYTRERIEINGTGVDFDGKGNPDTKTVKIYNMRGDVRLFGEALQNFCIDNGYTTCITKFHF